MAYGLKYEFSFNDNAANIAGTPVLVRVYIYKEGFDGDSQTLIPAESPCIISESNNEEDIFSPIRAKEISIRFVTDGETYPAVEDLLSNQDNEFKIEILVGDNIYLNGFLLNDRISEDWLTDGTNHVIEFSATDNLGVLKGFPLPGYLPTDKPTLYEIVRSALDVAVPDLTINIYDNLFETSHLNRSDPISIEYLNSFTATSSTKEIVFLIPNFLVNPGDTLIISGSISNDGTYTVDTIDRDQYFVHAIVLETLVDELNTQDVTMTVQRVGDTNCPYSQTRLDMRTFVSNYSDFDNCYDVLTKILESRNSVLFQHNGEWHIVRVPELFLLDDIPGTTYEASGVKSAVEWNATATISESGDFVPVENFIRKTYNNALKFNKVTFNYQNFDEFLCNQLWQRGVIVLDTATLKEYEVDCWSHYQGATISTTPASVNFGRRVEIDAGTEAIIDEYLFLEVETGSGGESFVRSAGTLVSVNDKLTISLQRRTKNGYTGSGNEILARVLLYANDATYYTLDDDGKWYLSNSTFTVNNKTLIYAYDSVKDRSEWVDKQVSSDFIPKDGTIYIHLQEASAGGSGGQETWFKDLDIKNVPYIEGKNFTSVTGDYHKLTLSSNFKDSKDYEIFISDSPKFLLKGAMFREDGVTLTTLWYQYTDETIIYPLKRWNAISHYRVTNRNFQNAEGTYFKWLKSEIAITPVQKIIFTNGNPNKTFLPATIRSIDTSKSIFDAFCCEVLDTTLSGNEFTATASFFVGVSQFLVNVQNDFLVVGNILVVSGTTLNDGTYTITAVNQVDISGVLSTYVDTAESTADELDIADVSFTVSNANGDNVFAEHEFKYIYKNTR